MVTCLLQDILRYLVPSFPTMSEVWVCLKTMDCNAHLRTCLNYMLAFAMFINGSLSYRFTFMTIIVKLL